MSRAKEPRQRVGDSSVVSMAGVPASATAKDALTHRAGILELTDEALRAVISPKETGAFAPKERAALACRIARINNNERLADYYKSLVSEAGTDPICDPAFLGGQDARLKAILSFTDLVSRKPRDATENEIAALKSIGLADADIVRLAELNAFLAYHIRVVEGLALVAGSE